MPCSSCDRRTTGCFSRLATRLDQSRQTPAALDAYLLAYRLSLAGSLIRCEQASSPPGGQRSFLQRSIALLARNGSVESWRATGRLRASWLTDRMPIARRSLAKRTGLSGWMVWPGSGNPFSVAPMRAAKQEASPRLVQHQGPSQDRGQSVSGLLTRAGTARCADGNP